MIDKANKAEKAELKLYDIFRMMEIEKLIPEIKADIPQIGILSNLYAYVFQCFSYCLTNRNNAENEEAYNFNLNQLNIIFHYLIGNGLIESDKQTAAPVSSKFQIPADVLEEHIRFTNADQNGLLTNHPDRDRIVKLWQDVLKFPDQKNHLYELQKINLNQITIAIDQHPELYNRYKNIEPHRTRQYLENIHQLNKLDKVA